MTAAPTFDELVTQIERRTGTMRRVISGADDRVRVRPGRTLRDLMFHVATVQRAGAEAISGWEPPRRIRVAERDNEDGLEGWAERSTFLLAHALRAAGPTATTTQHWASWGPPMTTRHVARRQLQEATVHAYDAQAGVGRPDPVPDLIAINGIDEFLRYRLAAQGPWPHAGARIEWCASMTPDVATPPGRREAPMFWLVDFAPAGISVVPRESGKPTAAMSGRAGDLLLALYGRTPLLAVDTTGDESLIAEVLARTDTACS
ncbi:MAG: hypothetical protein QOE51_785 [Actinoplanes sp.]|jgi:uncharacterized protein (TIGR03083 family)|nr:hypothetical protein [Actinoplanes sp.]